MIRKLVWSVNRAIAFLDKRKIKIPEPHKSFMLCDYWDCSLILSAENQGGEFTFETIYGRYRVFATCLTQRVLRSRSLSLGRDRVIGFDADL